jgi:hypothetical protein
MKRCCNHGAIISDLCFQEAYADCLDINAGDVEVSELQLCRMGVSSQSRHRACVLPADVPADLMPGCRGERRAAIMQ